MIIVYTRDLCGYCLMAMNHLRKNDIPFTEVNTSHDTFARKYIEEQGHTTYPQIYNKTEPGHRHNTLLVEGGCDGLIALSKEEILKRAVIETQDIF
jgi:glutaredoxin 3